MGTPKVPRLSIEPLMAATGCANPSQLARKLGMDSGFMSRIVIAGGFTPTFADRAAVKLGYLPMMVWGDEWLNLPDGACGRLDFKVEQEKKARGVEKYKRQTDEQKRKNAARRLSRDRANRANRRVGSDGHG
jgi:hypothetical protein